MPVKHVRLRRALVYPPQSLFSREVSNGPLHAADVTLGLLLEAVVAALHLSCSGSPDARKGEVISDCKKKTAAAGTTRTYRHMCSLASAQLFQARPPACPGSLHSQNVQPLTGLRVILIAAARDYESLAVVYKGT